MPDGARCGGGLWSLAGGLVAAVALFLLIPHRAASTPDSLSYLDVAAHVAQGHGVARTDLRLTERGFHRPMTAWPPLYPVVLVPFVSQSVPANHAVALLNAILLGGLLTLAGMAAARELGPRGGGLFGAFVLLQVPIATVYCYVWSETLFLPLVVGAYLAARRGAEARRATPTDAAWPWLVAGGAALLLACYTRLVALVFVPAFVATACVGLASARARALHAAGLAAAFGAGVAPLFIRNLVLAGSFSGLTRAPAAESVAGNLAQVGRLVELHLAGAGRWQLAPLAAFLGVAGAVALLRRAGRIARPADGAPARAHGDAALPLVWLGCYLAGVVTLRAWKHFDEVDTRLVAPAVPFLLLWLLALAGRLRATGALGRVGLVLLGCWAAAQVVHGGLTLAQAGRAWRQTGAPGLRADRDREYADLTSPPRLQTFRTVHAVLREREPDPVVVFDGAALLYRVATGARVKKLPAAPTRALLDGVGPGGFLVVTRPDSVRALAAALGRDVAARPGIPALRTLGVVAVPLPLD